MDSLWNHVAFVADFIEGHPDVERKLDWVRQTVSRPQQQLERQTHECWSYSGNMQYQANSETKNLKLPYWVPECHFPVYPVDEWPTRERGAYACIWDATHENGSDVGVPKECRDDDPIIHLQGAWVKQRVLKNACMLGLRLVRRVPSGRWTPKVCVEPHLLESST